MWLVDFPQPVKHTS